MQYASKKGIHIVFWWESQKERNFYEDLDVARG
jgi:hypothetical protein